MDRAVKVSLFKLTLSLAVFVAAATLLVIYGGWGVFGGVYLLMLADNIARS